MHEGKPRFHEEQNSTIEEWFEGFEKELRELQEQHDSDNDEWDHGYWTAIADILGDP